MDSLTVQVWKLDFPSPSTKLAALAIARRARETGKCWASQKTIGTDTGLSRKTVQRAIADLVEMGWITKSGRIRNDGGRSSDTIWLTLPQVVLEAVTVTHSEMMKAEDEDDLEAGHADAPQGHNVPRVGTQSPNPRVRESEQKESLKESSEVRGADAQFSLDGLVEMIWARVGEMGRKRSTKPKVRAALVAALNRRQKDQPLEDRLRLVLSGIDGYLKSPDARKDDGAFEHGAHRTLIGDFWESHATAPRSDDPAIDPEIGTLEHPGPALQRRWAEMARDGLPWAVETRGPRPGMHGCRIADDIQVEFGFTPWAPAHPAAIEETVRDVTPLQLKHQVDGEDDDAAAFA